MLDHNEHVIDYVDCRNHGDLRPELDEHVRAYHHKQDRDMLRRFAAAEGLGRDSLLGRMGII